MTPVERALYQEITRIKQDIAVRPIRVPTRGGTATATSIETWLQIVNGNTLGGGILGIAKITTPLPNQTTWADPYDTATLPNGLGRAMIWLNGVQGMVRDADKWKMSTAYNVGDKVRGTNESEAFKCTQAGTSAATGPGPSGTGTGIVDNGCKWDSDSTIGWKPQQVLALLDSHAQWSFAIAATEWSRVFTAIKVGNAIDPSTGVAADFSAYPLAFM